VAPSTYAAVALFALTLIPITALYEFASPSGYGRFASRSLPSWLSVSARVGWWLLELPCSLVFVAALLYHHMSSSSSSSLSAASIFLAVQFLVHYAYRGWLFPYLIRPHADSRFSLVIALGGWLVTVPHALLSAWWVLAVGPSCGHVALEGASGVRLILGGLLYAVGLALLVWHDALLRSLRPANADATNAKGKAVARYSIPRGGLFEYVTSAQYLCELVAWLGFALLQGSPNGLYILLVSTFNLVPRAVRTHAWYLQTFPDYPKDRRSILPFLC